MMACATFGFGFISIGEIGMEIYAQGASAHTRTKNTMLCSLAALELRAAVSYAVENMVKSCKELSPRWAGVTRRVANPT